MIANSEDPDQTRAVWSGSLVFAQIYLSENSGSLRYCILQFEMLSYVPTSENFISS